MKEFKCGTRHVVDYQQSLVDGPLDLSRSIDNLTFISTKLLSPTLEFLPCPYSGKLLTSLKHDTTASTISIVLTIVRLAAIKVDMIVSSETSDDQTALTWRELSKSDLVQLATDRFVAAVNVRRICWSTQGRYACCELMPLYMQSVLEPTHRKRTWTDADVSRKSLLLSQFDA